MRKVNRVIKSSIIIGVLVISIIVFIHSTALSYENIAYNEIYVSSGDTLWNIAKYEQEHNNYYKGKDVREIIYDIKKINNLSSSQLNVNQKILIPSL